MKARSVAALIEAAAGRATARGILAAANGAAPVQFVSLVDLGKRGPEQIESCADAAQRESIPVDCFARYRRHYFHCDDATRVAAELRAAGAARSCVVALHHRRADIPVARWREDVYERAHLTDRLALLFSPEPRASLAINLYRDETRGPLAPRELAALLEIAPLLSRALSAVRAARAERSADIDERIAAAHRALALRAPGLSPREREVCARLACGMTCDGIAADLSIGLSSVQTLRKRSYAKLRIHDRLRLARLAG